MCVAKNDSLCEAYVPPEDVQGVDQRLLNLPLVRNLDQFIAQRDSPFAIQ